MGQSRGGNGWVGWVIFVLLVFGSRLMPPVANWLSQLTGLSISPAMLLAAIIGVVAVGGFVGPAIARARRSSDSGSPSLPASMAPPTSRVPSVPQLPPSAQLPRSTGGLPQSMSSTRLPPPRLPSGEQKLPTAPKFDPIIDPRILSFGILGLLAIGGFFLFALSVGTP